MSWVQLVQAISTDFVARLAAAGMPPLTQGAIQIGPQYLTENQSTAPSVTFVPKGSIYSAPAQSSKGGTPIPGMAILGIAPTAKGIGYSSSPTVTIGPPDIAGSVQATATAVVVGGLISGFQMVKPGGGYLNTPTVTITDGTGTGAAALARLAPDPEKLAELATRSLGTDTKHFDVHIKGVTFTAGSPTPNPDTDYDFADLMFVVLAQSCQALMAQIHKFGKGDWPSANPQTTQIDVYGRELVVTLAISTPIPDVTLAFVPPGTMDVLTVQLQPQSGSASIAA